MRRTLLALGLCLLAVLPARSGDRVPGEAWMVYADPSDAGFDPAALEAARKTWEGLPSAAFLVVADGAIVASWGDVERRYMCHSVRKSFLSALYGIYWDRREIELNKTLADLDLDDEPDPLMDREKRARILDLLKARSGVFHPAAYAGRTDSRPRGSEGPGRFFAYNNWDFNTLAAILQQETGAEVFTAFDEHFARPLGMQDWRVRDGYYHYERDKSKYPAYPFRLSARDAARFGLLFAREGLWGDERILSEHWVRRSTALYSDDSPLMGYGMMWWVFRRPSLERHGMVAALGVGNQMIAALPKSDLVIVNRANTFERENTPMPALVGLIEQVLDARTGTPAEEPDLEPFEDGLIDRRATRVEPERLAEFVGEWDFPPAPLGLPARARGTVEAGPGHLIVTLPFAGTFDLHLQEDGSFWQADAEEPAFVVRDDAGNVAGLVNVDMLALGAVFTAARGDLDRAERLVALGAADPGVQLRVVAVAIAAMRGDTESAERLANEAIARTSPGEVEARINGLGYELLGEQEIEGARTLFELNTRLFVDSANAWDSLGEAYMGLGRTEESIEAYRRSLELNPRNEGAREMLERLEASR